MSKGGDMGGPGSGGARVKSGPSMREGSRRWRQKERRAKREAAGQGKPGRRVPAAVPVPEQTILPSGEVVAPADLPMEQGQVWERLAPLAMAAGTLTTATEEAFRGLCNAIVWERALAADVEERGGPNHRGMMVRVETGLLRFKLAPTGREAPAAQDDPEVDSLAAMATPTLRRVK